MANIQKKYVGILGGSFDPAHKGHLSVSKIAIKKFKLKKIYWVITKKNPFKNKTFYSLDERVKLAKKISRTQKKIQIIHLELLALDGLNSAMWKRQSSGFQDRDDTEMLK